MKRRLICRICEPEEVSLDTRPDVRVLIVLLFHLDSFLLEKFPPEFRENSLVVTKWLSWAKRTPFLRDESRFFFRQIGSRQFRNAAACAPRHFRSCGARRQVSLGHGARLFRSAGRTRLRDRVAARSPRSCPQPMRNVSHKIIRGMVS